MILALYWRGATRAGVLAGVATGAVTTVVWYLTPALNDLMYELIPAFFLAGLVTVVVSRFTTPPTEVERDFQVMEGFRPPPPPRPPE